MRTARTNELCGLTCRKSFQKLATNCSLSKTRVESSELVPRIFATTNDQMQPESSKRTPRPPKKALLKSAGRRKREYKPHWSLIPVQTFQQPSKTPKQRGQNPLMRACWRNWIEKFFWRPPSEHPVKFLLRRATRAGFETGPSPDGKTAGTGQFSRPTIARSYEQAV